MNNFKAFYPRLGLIVAGVALGLLARQVFGPPPEENLRPEFTIDRPIAESTELEGAGEAYVPVELPVAPVAPAKP